MVYQSSSSRVRSTLGLALALVLVAASGGDDGDVAVAAGTDNSEEELSLTLVSNTPDTDLVDVYLAETRGYFAAENLDVNFTYSDPAGSALAAGRADLVNTTTVTGLLLAMNEFPIVHVMTSTQNAGLALISSADYPTIESLQQAGSDCVFALQPPGGNSTAWGEHYIRELDLECERATVNDPVTTVNGIISGRYDATALSVGFAQRAVVEGAHLLIDPLAEDFEQYSFPRPFMNTDFWTTPEILEEKREAIVRFVRAVVNAQEEREASLELSDVMEALRISEPVFAASEEEDLAAQLEVGLQIVSQEAITPEIWEGSLRVYAQYGLEAFDPDDPAVTYENAVDPSVYEDATSGE